MLEHYCLKIKVAPLALIVRYESPSRTQWTKVNLNWNRTEPFISLSDARQVSPRHYPMSARFQL